MHGFELPPTSIRRWTARRKAAVVVAVIEGEHTMEAICARYGVERDEFTGWRRRYEKFGVAGLRTTRLQSYRRV